MNDKDFFEELLKEKSSVDSELGEGDGGEEARIELAKAASPSAPAKPRQEARRAAKNEARASKDDGEPEGQLTLDVYQTPNDIVVESAIAGVKPEDIDINVTNDSVSVKGERRREQEIKDSDYIYQECYWGRFSRSVILPHEVDPDDAEVAFKNGILTIRLPKLNKKKQKRLKVKAE